MTEILDESSLKNIDPYEALEIDVSSVSKSDITPDQIKKAYRKLALKVHPDKAKTEEERQTFHAKFQTVAFAYSVLSDVARKARYDRTGSLEDLPLDGEQGEDGYSLREFLNNLWKSGLDEITEDAIKEDKEKYRKNEEYDDLIRAYKKHKGDFALIYEEILHTQDDTDADFVRLVGIVQSAIDSGAVKKYKAFGNWKKARDSTFAEAGSDEEEEEEESEEEIKAKPKPKAKSTKKRKTEAEEAEEMAVKLGLRNKGSKDDGMASLQALITQKRGKRMADLLDNLEDKYGKKGKKPKREVAQESFAEPSEEEFLRIQKEIEDRRQKPKKQSGRKAK